MSPLPDWAPRTGRVLGLFAPAGMALVSGVPHGPAETEKLVAEGSADVMHVPTGYPGHTWHPCGPGACTA